MLTMLLQDLHINTPFIRNSMINSPAGAIVWVHSERELTWIAHKLVESDVHVIVCDYMPVHYARQTTTRSPLQQIIYFLKPLADRKRLHIPSVLRIHSPFT